MAPKARLQIPVSVCVCWREAGLGDPQLGLRKRSGGWGSVMGQARRPGTERTVEELEGTPGEQSIRLGGGGYRPNHPLAGGRRRRGLGERRFLLRNKSGTLFEGWGSRPRTRLEGPISAVLWG